MTEHSHAVLVISCLNSLMENQAQGLKSIGIKSVQLTCDANAESIKQGK